VPCFLWGRVFGGAGKDACKDSAPIRAKASTMLERVIMALGHVRLAISVNSVKSSGDIITVTGVVLLGIHISCGILCFTSNKYDAWIPWNIYNLEPRSNCLFVWAPTGTDVCGKEKLS
jgi:hypothetical protein